MKEFLPIGTVVSLTEDTEYKFMIVGYYPTNPAGEQRDFAAVRFPMGVYDNRMFFFFNHSEISKVLHRGLEDEEFESFRELIEGFMEEKAKNQKE